MTKEIVKVNSLDELKALEPGTLFNFAHKENYATHSLTPPHATAAYASILDDRVWFVTQRSTHVGDAKPCYASRGMRMEDIDFDDGVVLFTYQKSTGNWETPKNQPLYDMVKTAFDKSKQ